MTVGAILTLGLGTFSDVNHLVTLGYGTGAVPVTPTVDAPTAVGGGKPKRTRFLVKCRGKQYLAYSLDEVRALVEEFRAEERLEQPKKKKARRVVRVEVPKELRLELKTHSLPSILPMIERHDFMSAKEVLERLEAIKRQMDDDDEDDVEMLLLH